MNDNKTEKKQSQIFKIRSTERKHAMSLFTKDDKRLFSIGTSDIIVYKHNCSFKSYCLKKSFESKKEELLGKQGTDDRFDIKRIIVWKLNETEEQRKQREQQIETVIKGEKEELIKSINKIPREFTQSISKIEEWTSLKFKTILFDSKYCKCKVGESYFDKHIFNQENIAICIQTDSEIYGGFLYSKVDKYRSINNGIVDGVVDSKSFLFTSKNDKQFKVKRDEQNKPIFFLYEGNEDERLFAFGIGEIWIGKDVDNVKKGYCRQDSKTMYDFKTSKKVLTGKTGSEQINYKRIMVCQFENQSNSDEEQQKMKKAFEKSIQKDNQLYIEINQHFG